MARGIERGAAADVPLRLTGEIARREAHTFVGRKAQIERFHEWITNTEPHAPVVDVHGPVGIGKTSLLRVLGGIAHDMGRDVLAVDARSVGRTAEGLVAALGVGDPTHAEKRLGTGAPFLVIDDVDAIPGYSELVEDWLLPMLDPYGHLVVSTRFPVGRPWEHREVGHRATVFMSLSSLSTDEARAMLARRGIDDARAVEHLVEVATTYPLVLATAADLYSTLGVRDVASAPEWMMVRHWIARRITREISDPFLRSVLDAAVVAREFDEASLAAIASLSAAEANRAFSQLSALAIARPSECGVGIRTQVRRILAQDLEWRNPELYSLLDDRRIEHHRRRLLSGREFRSNPVVELMFPAADPVARRLLFSEDNQSVVRVTPPWSAEEADTLVGLAARRWADRSRADLLARANLVAWLTATRALVARDRAGTPIGLAVSMALTPDTEPLLREDPAIAAIIKELFAADGDDGERPVCVPVHVIVLLEVTGPRADVARSALLRALVESMSPDVVYIASSGCPEWNEMFEGLRFQRVESGYQLDLSRIGIASWAEMVRSGRLPPRVATATEVETELRRVLVHWHDDRVLSTSTISEFCWGDLSASGTPPSEGVRQAVRRSLGEARAVAPPDAAIAYRALELAYLQRAANQESIARELGVSRSQFYRLLQRATAGVAERLLRP